MRFHLHYELVVRDRRGRVVRRRRGPCRSEVLAWIDILYSFLAASAQTVPDTSNTGRVVDITGPSPLLNATAAAADSAKGPVVGTGTNAVAMGDYDLQTKVAEGTGAGQLNYGAATFTAPTTAGSTRSFTIQRTFTNNSGAQITINEVGLGANHADSGGAGRYFLLVRDIVSATAVPALGSATLTYTGSITV